VDSPFLVEGKVAIVTGSGRGIGKATALALAEAGAEVVVLSRTAVDVEETAAEVHALGRRALAIPMDVRVSEQVNGLVDRTLGEFGRVDILVNNVGTSFPVSTLQLTESGWDSLVQTNLKPPYLCGKAVAEPMIRQGGGSIINISSAEGVTSATTCSAYAAAKAGVINLTRSLAVEWAPYGIRVNCIVPGYIATKFVPLALEQYPSLRENVARIPMGHMGKAEDIAYAVVYLASEASAYVTGAMLTVDGGLTCRFD
jgi:NAD(P)-dependent dehydrogenase (short-subunit alcohol dehydrogenase family)